jgi:rhodanese-related sulfurtransferase
MSTKDNQQPKSASQIVAEARQTMQEITVAQAREELDQGQAGLLLDVREPAEWVKGHIPGAVLAPRGMLEWYADPTTPYAKPELTTKRDARIIVACASGGALHVGGPDTQINGLHQCGEHGWRIQRMEQARVPRRVVYCRDGMTVLQRANW